MCGTDVVDRIPAGYPMPCGAGSAVYSQRVPYLRGDFRYGFLCNRKLRSYYTKNAPRGCAPRGEVNNALHTARAQVCGKRTLCSAGFFCSAGEEAQLAEKKRIRCVPRGQGMCKKLVKIIGK